MYKQEVEIEIKDTDKYKRKVCLVIVEGNKCANEELLKAGLAWHYKQYDKNPEWAKLENEARTKKIGLWSGSEVPVAPWEWRKKEVILQISYELIHFMINQSLCMMI